MNCSVGLSEISIAPPSTSPSPCTAWPSPVKNWPPLLNTGRNSDAPIPVNLRSMFPPHARRRRHRHDAHERIERNLNVIGKQCHASLKIDADQLRRWLF